jgi:hypothetical protein
MNSNLYTILVNTSDGFDDCWNPFFILLNKYWSNCQAPILLNTEHKDFSFYPLNIKASKVNSGNVKRLTWSECLIEAIKKVDSPLILYFQEDYFIESIVNVPIIDQFAKMMILDDTIKHIGLTNFGSYPPFNIYPEDKRLMIVSNKSKYRISTQVGLWKKETLLKYLRSDENGWMFEIFGTQRSTLGNDLFLTSNRALFNEHNPIILYKVTGIIKGKWLTSIPVLFEQEGIEVDFSQRGFYKQKYILFRKFETAITLLKKPMKLLKFIYFNVSKYFDE